MRARRAYENETDIVEIVRKLRFLQEAVTSFVGNEKSAELQKKNNYSVIMAKEDVAIGKRGILYLQSP